MMGEEPLKHKLYDLLSTVKIATHSNIKTFSSERKCFVQTIWKWYESIAILLKAQKYKTSTIPILPVFQIQHKDGNAINQRCEQLIPQIHVHYKVLPSILRSTPKLLFKTSSTISKAPLTHAIVENIQLLRLHMRFLHHLYLDLHSVTLRWPFPQDARSQSSTI